MDSREQWGEVRPARLVREDGDARAPRMPLHRVEERDDLADVVDRVRRERDVNVVSPCEARPVQVAHLDVGASGCTDRVTQDVAHRLGRLDGDHTGDMLAQREREAATASADVEPGVARPGIGEQRRQFERRSRARPEARRNVGIEVARRLRLTDAGDLLGVRVHHRRPRRDGSGL